MLRYVTTFVFVLVLLGAGGTVRAQVEFDVSVSSNRAPSSLEHNALFNAQSRYSVSQTGAASFDVDALFDGRLSPSYTQTGVDPDQPTVITIEDLPPHYRQGGVWVGWTTRYWPAEHFKIEAYDVRDGYNDWRTIADYSATEYDGSQFLKRIGYNGIYTKVRYTFYEGRGGNYGGNGHRRVGVSELLYVNPEMGRPYRGFISKDMWALDGKVGLGTKAPEEKLSVAGNVLAEEVIVKPQDQWSDYVLDENYDLPTLTEVSSFIEAEGHLPNVPSAVEVEKNGLPLGEMDATLLRKVEELTLYAIEQKRRADSLATRTHRQARSLKQVHRENDRLRRCLDAQKRRLDRLMRTVQQIREADSSSAPQ